MTVQSLTDWWSFVFLGVLVYAMGDGFKHLFPGIAEQRWYQRSVVFHAPLVATAIAITPWFPMPPSIGLEIGPRALFGAVAGIAAAWLYKAFRRLLGVDTSSRRAR